MTTTRTEPATLAVGLDRSWVLGTLARLLAFVLAELAVLVAARSSGLPDAEVGAGLLLVVLTLAVAAVWAAVDGHRRGRPAPVLVRWALVAAVAGLLPALWDAGTGLHRLGGVTAVLVLAAAAVGCLAGVLTARRPPLG